MELTERYCPICKKGNERGAIVCIHCGASLESPRSDLLATVTNPTTLEKISAKITDSPVDDSLIPDDGIAIYVAGTSKPVYLWFDKELVFGRKADGLSQGTFLDLSELGGHQAGISRRHAMIRRGEDGYEIVDLSSTNGSWLNDKRLIPHKPVPLASGSQLRFGLLRLLVLHHYRVSKKKNGGQLG